MAFVRWNQTTQIWEVAATPESPSTPWNHLPVQNPTLALDIANKAYVDSKTGGGPFVPYNGANANVNLGAYNLFAGRIGIGGGVDVAYPFQVHNAGQSGDLLLNVYGNQVHYNSAVVGNNLADTGHVFYTRQGTGIDNIRLVIQTYYVRVAADLYVDGGVFERGRSQRMGDWQTWSPAWKSYLGTDGVIGNGYIVARYSVVGKTVFYTIQLGIGSTTVLPSGQWAFSLPLPSANNAIEGAGHVYDGTSGAIFQATLISATYFFGISNSVGAISGNTGNLSDSFVRSTYPFTFKASDSFFFSGFYEIT